MMFFSIRYVNICGQIYALKVDGANQYQLKKNTAVDKDYKRIRYFLTRMKI